jgi:prepilin peptidase CpaA
MRLRGWVSTVPYMNNTQAFAELMWMLLGDLRYSLLLGLLAVACLIDVRSFKIPNWLTFGGAAFALIYSAVVPFSDGEGFIWSLGGLAAGLAIMLPAYALRVMGAGDVKLMAMVGAFLGLTPTVYAALFVFVCGGVLAMGHAVLRGALLRLTGNVKAITQGALYAVMGGMRPNVDVVPAQSIGKMPFALSIALGTTAFLVAQQLGF